MNLRQIILKCAISSLILFPVFSSCVSKSEHELTQSELVAVKQELQQRDSVNELMANTMENIGTLIDSLEITEEQIMLNLEKGIPYDDYVARLDNIKAYMEKSNRELMEMEDLLSSAYAKNRVYENMLKDYKRSLAEKDSLIVQLTYAIEEVKSKNQMLVKTIHLQSEEIEALQKEIGQKQSEMEMVESQLDATKEEVVSTRAEKYLSLAESTEELANKTSSLFNAKKKKAYYRQALDYYKKVLEIDEAHEVAKTKVVELEEKI